MEELVWSFKYGKTAFNYSWESGGLGRAAIRGVPGPSPKRVAGHKTLCNRPETAVIFVDIPLQLEGLPVHHRKNVNSSRKEQPKERSQPPAVIVLISVVNISL